MDISKNQYRSTGGLELSGNSQIVTQLSESRQTIFIKLTLYLAFDIESLFSLVTGPLLLSKQKKRTTAKSVELFMFSFFYVTFFLLHYSGHCTNPWDNGENYQEWFHTATSLYFETCYRRATLRLLVRDS